MANQWYYSKGEESVGPISSKEIRRLAGIGVIQPDDQVWNEDMDDWVPASRVKGLFPHKDRNSKSSRTSQPQSQPAKPPPVSSSRDHHAPIFEETSNLSSGRKSDFDHHRTYCRNCGKQVAKNAVACLSCGMDPNNGSKFCPSCGAETNPVAVICVKCGVGLGSGEKHVHETGGSDRVFPSDPPKEPILMCLLTLLLVGLGQMIVGQTGKGLLYMIGTSAFIVGTCFLGLYVLPIIWIFVGLDAFLIAKKLQSGKSVGKWEFF